MTGKQKTNIEKLKQERINLKKELESLSHVEPVDKSAQRVILFLLLPKKNKYPIL